MEKSDCRYVCVCVCVWQGSTGGGGYDISCFGLGIHGLVSECAVYMIR